MDLPTYPTLLHSDICCRNVATTKETEPHLCQSHTPIRPSHPGPLDSDGRPHPFTPENSLLCGSFGVFLAGANNRQMTDIQ